MKYKYRIIQRNMRYFFVPNSNTIGTNNLTYNEKSIN